MSNDLLKFSTLDEAKDYFQEQKNISQKYGMLLCYVGNRFTCLMGTAMVEDEYTRGPIEAIVEDFLNEIDAPIDIIDAVPYCGAEMTNTMYKILSQYGVDVEFVYDTF